MLEELLQRWTQSYVMHAQRAAHALALGATSAEVVPLHGGGVNEGTGASASLAVANGPRIELF